MRGTPEQRSHVGQTVTTAQAVSVYSVWLNNVAVNPAEEDNTGPAQGKLATLPRGTPVAIKGMVYYRFPWGVPEYYVCRAARERLSFDVQTTDAEQFLVLPPRRGE